MTLAAIASLLQLVVQLLLAPTLPLHPALLHEAISLADQAVTIANTALQKPGSSTTVSSTSTIPVGGVSATPPATAASSSTPSPASVVTMNITSPAGGATVAGTISLQATATTTSGTISQVQFLIDGTNLGGAVTSSPYTISWNTVTAANGSHTIKVVGTDSNNTTSSASITVTVSNTAAATSSFALGWSTLTTTGTTPHFRAYSQVVYDPAQKKTLYLAGQDDLTIYSNALFGFDSASSSWSLLNEHPSSTSCPASVSNFPSSRHPYMQVAYDTTRDRMWLFSGVCNTVSPTDTWYYDSGANTWVQVSPPSSPTGRQEDAMAYDPADDVIVLYGGLASPGGATSNQTWQYSPSANTWTQITTTGDPGVLAGQRMLYDPVVHKIVMYGGYTSFGATEGNDIWLYDVPTHTWTNPNPITKPPATAGFPIMGYDSVLQREILYTGTSSVWSYDSTGNTWTHLGIFNGPATFTNVGPEQVSMDYDSTNDVFIADTYLGCGGCWSTSALKLASTSVSISSPTDGSTVSGTVTITALPTSGVAGISNVQFKLDGSNLGAAVTSTPFTFSWDTTGASPGSHALTAVVTDTSGGTATSPAVNVTVNNAVNLAFVQSTSASSTIAQSTSTVRGTFASPLTAGDLVVVAIASFPGTPSSTAVTDSLGNTYTEIGTVLTTGQSAHSALYYAKNVTAGSDTITVTYPATGSAITMAAGEFSGLNAAAPLDQTAAVTGSGTAVSSGSMTPANSNELVIGAGTHDALVTVTPGTGFTIMKDDEVSGHQPITFEYKFVTSTTPLSADFTLSANTTWSQHGATFKQ